MPRWGLHPDPREVRLDIAGLLFAEQESEIRAEQARILRYARVGHSGVADRIGQRRRRTRPDPMRSLGIPEEQIELVCVRHGDTQARPAQVRPVVRVIGGRLLHALAVDELAAFLQLAEERHRQGSPLRLVRSVGRTRLVHLVRGVSDVRSARVRGLGTSEGQLVHPRELRTTARCRDGRCEKGARGGWVQEESPGSGIPDPAPGENAARVGAAGRPCLRSSAPHAQRLPNAAT